MRASSSHRSVPRRDVEPLIRRMFSSLSSLGIFLSVLFFIPLVIRFLSDRASDTRSSVIVINLPIYIYIPGTLCGYTYIYVYINKCV